MKKLTLILFVFMFSLRFISPQLPAIRLNETTNQTFLYDSIMPIVEMNFPENYTGYSYDYFMPINTSVSGDFDFNQGWLNGGLSIQGGDIYAQTGYFYNISALTVTNLRINGSLIPNIGFDNTFDLGSSSSRWKDLYLGGQLYSNGTGNSYFLGNVGIGTASPSALLDVQGSLGHFLVNADGARLKMTRPSANYLDANVAGGYFIFNVNGISTGATNSPLILASNGQAHFMAGNVGIGTASPVSTLNVESSVAATPVMIVNKSGETSGNALQINNAGSSRSLEINHNADGSGIVDDIIRVNNDGTEVFEIDNAGNVGIGTTSPDYLLELTATNPALSFEDTTGGKKWRIENSGNDFGFIETGVGTKMLIETGGNVGIGTTTPIVRTGYTAPWLTLSSVATGIAFIDSNSANSATFISSNGGQFQLGKMNDDGTNDNVFMTIQSDGDVGIGTASPNAKLDVNSSGGGTSSIAYFGNDSDGLSVYSVNANGYIDVVGINRAINAYNDVHLRALNGIQLYLDTTGNVGIGTTSPSNSLTIQGQSGVATKIKIQNSDYVAGSVGSGLILGTAIASGQTYGQIYAFKTGDTAYSDLVIPGGKVGVGTNSPDKLLHIESTSSPTFRIEDTTNNVQFIAQSADNFAEVGTESAHDFYFVTSNAVKMMIDDGTGNVGIGTTSPTQKLDVVGSINQTGGNVYVNNIYGGMLNHSDTGVTVPIGVQNVYYNFSFMQCGNLNGVTCDGENLTIGYSGVYEIKAEGTGSGQANHAYHLAVTRNGVPLGNITEGHQKMANAGDIVNMVVLGQTYLSSGDIIKLSIRDSSGTGDGTSYSSGLFIRRIGN